MIKLPTFREAGHEGESIEAFIARREQCFPKKRAPRQKVKTIYVDRVIKEKTDLTDTLAKMEAAAARAAQPGANIPPAIKELMDENLTDEQNVERLRRRWAALTNQQMAEAQKSNALPALTDAERNELTTLNSWDKLRGG